MDGHAPADAPHDFDGPPAGPCSICHRAPAAPIHRAAKVTDRDILLDLVIDEPWSSSWEGLDDACMFCGSGAREYGTETDGVKWWHEATCPWMRAVAYIGRAEPKHGYLADRPKPGVAPCETCRYDPNATLDSHMKHLAVEYAARRERILERRAAGLPDESMFDYFPVMKAARGGIKFAPPVSLEFEDKPVGEVTTVLETASGLQIGGFVTPHSAMYELFRPPELPEQFVPDEDDVASFMATIEEPTDG